MADTWEQHTQKLAQSTTRENSEGHDSWFFSSSILPVMSYASDFLAAALCKGEIRFPWCPQAPLGQIRLLQAEVMERCRRLREKSPSLENLHYGSENDRIEFNAMCILFTVPKLQNQLVSINRGLYKENVLCIHRGIFQP